MLCFYVNLECKYSDGKCFASYEIHAVSASNAREIAMGAVEKEGLTVIDVDEVTEIECTHVDAKKQGVVEVYGKAFFEDE